MVALVGLTGLWAVVAQPFTGRGPALGFDGASAAKLEHHVQMLAEELPERSDDVGSLNVSAQYIFESFAEHGMPEYQTFDVLGRTYKNVVLRLGPLNEAPIVVGAHYDTAGGLPGADDNASGVAGLLELARLMDGANPAVAVELVAYALEESPYFGTEHMGSHHHASLRHGSPQQPRLMISLEMIGYYRDESGSQSYPIPGMERLYSDRGNFIAVIGRLAEIPEVRTIKRAFAGAAYIPVHSLTFPPVVPGMDLSDHLSYWVHGVKAVMITDTAFNRNPYYHSEADRPHTLDFQKMAQVVNGVYAAILALQE